jgi:hypothetical protein
MFRAATVGLAGSVALAVFAPSETAVETMPKVTAEAPAKPTPTPSEKPSPTQPEIPAISFETPELPQNIGSIANATVEVVSPIANTEFASFGSGTILDIGPQNIVMTAAHVTQEMNTACAENTVSYPSTQKLNHISEGFSAVSPAEKIIDYPDGTDSYTASTYNKGIDAAVVIPESQIVFAGRPSLTVQESVEVEPGETVFSLGYGPRDKKGYNPDPLSDDAQAKDPQIIPGTVLGQDGNKIKFITGATGYGMNPDNDVREGDSGGTFIDAEGNYLGDMIASVTNIKGTDIEAWFDVDLPDGTENKMYNYGITQIIDKPILKSLMNQTVECTN